LKIKQLGTNGMIMLNIAGKLNKSGEIIFPQGKSLNWKNLSAEKIPQLPSGVNIELSISIDINSLISGIDGFVWATKDAHQAEIINNSLNVQKIESEIVFVELDKKSIYLIKVTRQEDVNEVIDFIQNDKSGLRLKSDWDYPEGERNQSFEQWLND
jgi:hypothetical protein